MNFKTFRNKETGIEAQYPAHYETHPAFKDLLEVVDEDKRDEYEEDKVVLDDAHELPVEQRTARRSVPKHADEPEAVADETSDKE